MFAALGDATRLKLVTRLCADGPMSIAQLTSGLDITRQATTKHLNVLAEAGIARGVRFGRESRWELEPRQLEHARRSLELISAQWDRALLRLQRFVEEE